jgi:DNA-directed RNA polymerase specialized sigma24 family protein
VSGKHGRGRLQVEQWEIDVVKQVARAYQTDYEELEAELFRCFVLLKTKHLARARDWKSFLARSLYNAANNFVRDKHLRESRTQPLEFDHDETASPQLLDVLACPDEPNDFRIDLTRLWAEMPAKLRHLCELLLEEEGNITAVAQKLRRPRKTVDYWIHKFRHYLKSRSMSP